MFCCWRIHAPTPFTTAKDVRNWFDRKKIELTEKIRTLDWQIAGLCVQGNSLETEIRGYWGYNQQGPNNPTDEGLEELRKELEELKEELSSALDDRRYCKRELEENERAHARHMQNHEDDEPHCRHFLKWASTSVPDKARKGPFKHVIQVTEDVTFHEKELYAMVTKEEKRQDKEEEERGKNEGRNGTGKEKEEEKERKAVRSGVERILKRRWKTATLRIRLYTPLPDGNYCELECGYDREILRSQRIQLGNTLDCMWHHRRYYICLYVGTFRC